MVDRVVPQVSLIVATRNRRESLRCCLASLERLRPRLPWELIVVDNGSSDGTAGTLREFLAHSSIPARVVSEPRAGVARARNAGIAIARGEILAFTDDDCYPREDLLDELARIFEEDETVGVVGGRILLYDATDAPVTIQTLEEEIRFDRDRAIRPGAVHGANLAVRRAVVKEIGGFDPMLGNGTPFPCEDVEFAARAHMRGWEVGYFPGPVVYHHHRRKPGPAVDELRRHYDRGRGAYYGKFVFGTPHRRVFLRSWYWQARLQLRQSEFSPVAREVWGALRLGIRRLTVFEPPPRIL